MYRCAQPNQWPPHLRHMLEAAEKIIEYVGDLSAAEFYSSDMTYDATRFEIIVIGEAARRLTDQTRAQIPDVPWDPIRGMRNRVAHEYDRMNEEIFWEAVTISVPALAATLRGILAGNKEA